MRWTTIPTRYLLNDIALEKRIPLFHGAIRGFYGQATTIIPGKTACLRCIFPSAPPKEVFPVVGVTPGFIGMIQVTEVLKYLLGTGELLSKPSPDLGRDNSARGRNCSS